MADLANASELAALIDLLDDPSETVQQAVHARLGELGRGVVPRLREAQQHADEPLRSRLGEIAHTLHISPIEQAWSAIMNEHEGDLERGAFLVALYRYPDLDIPAYRARLDALAEAVRPRVLPVAGYGRAEVLTRFMFDDLGFAGNRAHYYDPENSYLNRVIDRRLGIPLSLSVVYLLLARRLGLPVYGVNMPAHFLVKYEESRDEIFIDLFQGGVAFSKEDGVRSLLKAGITPHAQFFEAASEKSILLRMVRNLVLIAEETNQPQSLSDLRRFLDPWESKM